MRAPSEDFLAAPVLGFEGLLESLVRQVAANESVRLSLPDRGLRPRGTL